MARRILSVWFTRLASERAQRMRPLAGPLGVSARHKGALRLACVNAEAAAAGLAPGMGLAQARAICPGLATSPADGPGEARFLRSLARWAGRYTPWVGEEPPDALVLDITGCAHLFGGEAALVHDLEVRAARAGLSVQTGLADTPAAARALARHAPGIAAPGQAAAALAGLPVAALGLSAGAAAALARLGVGQIGALAALPRATLPARFGPEVLERLDAALGARAEPIAPLAAPERLAVRLRLPEPIGHSADVMAGLSRLLAPLCTRLEARGQGARVLVLTLSRVDGAAQAVELRLATPMRSPARIAPLFARGVEAVEAGFGIEALHLAVTRAEPLPAGQTEARLEARPERGPEQPRRPSDAGEGLGGLFTRIGARIGLERLLRFLPAESHMPERAFLVAPAAFTAPAGPWPVRPARPLRLFAPAPIAGEGAAPPVRFRWRGRNFRTRAATGPERIAPEWWLPDEGWRAGLRDYWVIDTEEGTRLWLFYTPQRPGWCVAGEFA